MSAAQVRALRSLAEPVVASLDCELEDVTVRQAGRSLNGLVPILRGWAGACARECRALRVHGCQMVHRGKCSAWAPALHWWGWRANWPQKRGLRAGQRARVSGRPVRVLMPGCLPVAGLAMVRQPA